MLIILTLNFSSTVYSYVLCILIFVHQFRILARGCWRALLRPVLRSAIYAARNAASAARPTACVETDGVEDSAERSLGGLAGARHPPSQLQTPNEEFNSLSRQFSMMSHSEADAGALNPNANANTPLLPDSEHALPSPSRYASLHQSERLESEEPEREPGRPLSTVHFAQSDTHHSPNNIDSLAFRTPSLGLSSPHTTHSSPHHLNICSELENFPPMYPAGRIVQIIEERVGHGYRMLFIEQLCFWHIE